MDEIKYMLEGYSITNVNKSLGAYQIFNALGPNGSHSFINLSQDILKHMLKVKESIEKYKINFA